MTHKMFVCLVLCIFTYQPAPVHLQGLTDAMQDFSTFNSPTDFPSDAGGFPSDAGGFPSDAGGFPSDSGFPPNDPPTDPGVPAKPKTPVDPKKPSVDQIPTAIGTGHGKGDSGMPQDLGMTVDQGKKTDTGMPVEGFPKDVGPADRFPGEPGFPPTDTGMPIGQEKPKDTGAPADGFPAGDPFGFPDDTGFQSDTGPPPTNDGSSELPFPFDFFGPTDAAPPPPKEEISLDNAFLPNIPIGRKFTNLETGETKEFNPFDKSNTVNDKGTSTLGSSHLDSSGKPKGVKPVIPTVDISPDIPPFEPIPVVDPVPVIVPDVKPDKPIIKPIQPDVKPIDPIVKPTDTGKPPVVGGDKHIDPWATPHIDQATKDRLLAEMMNPNRGGGIFVPPKTHFEQEPTSHIDSIIKESDIHIDQPIFIEPQPQPKPDDAWKLNKISGGLSGYKGRTRKQPRVAPMDPIEPIQIETSAVEQRLKERIVSGYGKNRGMTKSLRKLQREKYRKERRNRRKNRNNRNRKNRNRNNIGKPKKKRRFFIPPLNGGRRGGRRNRGNGGNKRYKRQTQRFGISTL